MARSIVVSACDATLFHLGLDLVLSIRAVAPEQRILMLDLGMTADQRGLISALVDRVVEPGWDIDGVGPHNAPGWFRVMTCRAFLPDYAPGHDVILWIDADAWVQSATSLEAMTAAAEGDHLAIVAEDYDHISPFSLIDAAGRTVAFDLAAETLRSQNKAYYAPLLSPADADAMAELPTLNAGVFALRSAASGWGVWRERLTWITRRGAGLNKMIDQLALSIAVYSGGLACRRMPIENNFIITHERPAWDAARRRLLAPRSGAEIGILHLTDLKAVSALPLPVWGEPGREVIRPPRYLPGLQA